MLDNPARRAADARMGRPPLPACPQRRALFERAADLLGGQRAAAALLGIDERSVRRMIAGEHGIRDGIMQEVRQMLIARRQQAADLGAEIRAHLSEGSADGQD